MNQNTRQRLIGTLVLAVAALILLPVIFDGESSYQPVLQTTIPARPAQPVPARSDPQRPIITADTDAILINQIPDTGAPTASSELADTGDGAAADQAPATAQSPEPAAEQPASQQSASQQSEPRQADTVAVTSTPTPTLDNQGLPQGFSVRLGSFGNASNASNLVTRLQEAGHRAYSRRIESSQGPLTAVFVGPVIDRATANTLLETLRQDFELNGMIVRYEIEEL